MSAITPPLLDPEPSDRIADTKGYFASIGLDPGLVDAAAAAREEEPLAAPAADTRNKAEKEFDRAFGPPPAPGDYLPSYREHPPADSVTDLVAYHADVTNALAAMRMEPRTGEYILERSHDLARQFTNGTDVDRELFKREQAAALTDLFGVDGVKLHIQLAARGLARAPEAFRDRFLQSAAADSAEIIRLLAHNEARQLRRSGGSL